MMNKVALQELVGLIDIGSNTIRLVIYAIDQDFDYLEIHNIKNPARLSLHLEEVDGVKTMNSAGIKKLIDTLKAFQKIATNFHVDKLYPFATAAIRQASNRKQIIEEVKKQTGLKMFLLSEEEEAYYGAYAVIHTMPLEEGLTVDIGGGSCEVTHFKDQAVIHRHSFPFGAVSLQEEFFEDAADRSPKKIDKLKRFLKSSFKEIPWLKDAKLPLVAMGGSARSVANVYQRHVQYPIAGLHGFVMDEGQIKETLDLFLETPPRDMGDIEGLSGDRADIIIPATLTFQQLMNVSEAEVFNISTQGLREGYIMSYINEHYGTPLDHALIKVRAIRQLTRDLPLNTFGSALHINYIISLYSQLTRLGLLDYHYETQELLEYASALYLSGNFISSEADSQHTFYMLSNMNIFGFSHVERLKLALLASYRNRSLYWQYMENFTTWLSPKEKAELLVLGGLLKFTSALNESKTGPIQHFTLTRLKDESYQLNIYYQDSVLVETFRVERYKKHLERALDNPLTIQFIPIERNNHGE